MRFTYHSVHSIAFSVHLRVIIVGAFGLKIKLAFILIPSILNEKELSTFRIETVLLIEYF